MSKKQQHYDLNTKLKVIFAKKEGFLNNKQIQAKYQITNKTQIYQWLAWFDKKEIHRLQQQRGRQYKYHKGIYANKNEVALQTFKAAIKKKLGINPKKNKKLYFAIIREYKEKIPLNQLLRWLGLAKTTYYRWLKQSFKPQFLSPVENAIIKICKRNRRFGKFILGYRKVHHKLLKIGFKINPKTVLTKMQQFYLLCQTIKNKRQKHLLKKPPLSDLNLLQNNFYASSPYEKLCTDITTLIYGPNYEKKLYLSAIMDLYNREIIAYTIADKQDLSLVMDTLNQLKSLKRPCLFHSDQGSQYTAKKFKTILKQKGYQQSFSDVGVPSQNACIESFWGNLKGEKLYLSNLEQMNTKKMIQMVHKYILFYNQKRTIQSLKYLSPQLFAQHLNNQKSKQFL
ncbi:MAG: IS3 family transposase [Lettuce witches'-broom phytoplasma]